MTQSRRDFLKTMAAIAKAVSGGTPEQIVAAIAASEATPIPTQFPRALQLLAHFVTPLPEWGNITTNSDEEVLAKAKSLIDAIVYENHARLRIYNLTHEACVVADTTGLLPEMEQLFETLQTLDNASFEALLKSCGVDSTRLFALSGFGHVFTDPDDFAALISAVAGKAEQSLKTGNKSEFRRQLGAHIDTALEMISEIRTMNGAEYLPQLLGKLKKFLPRYGFATAEVASSRQNRPGREGKDTPRTHPSSDDIMTTIGKGYGIAAEAEFTTPNFAYEETLRRAESAKISSDGPKTK